MSTYKQTGRTIVAVIEGKPFIVTAKDAETLKAIKDDLDKLSETKSEKVKKTITSRLMKQFKPKEELKVKEKEDKVAKLKGEKAKAKKEVKETATKGRSKTDKAKTGLAVIVNDVAASAEAKLEKAVEAAKEVAVTEQKPQVGVRRSGEH
jgi:hypothetical protein